MSQEAIADSAKPMTRYRLTVEYDGTPYSGFQRQDNFKTVQGVLEAGIKAFSQEDVTIKAAGRTDAGVHATGQVVHFDMLKHYPAKTVMDAMNSLMRPEPVCVLEAAIVDDDFDARFSATARHYRYVIVNRFQPLTLERHQAWWVKKRLDADAMHRAAQRLIGTHDFTTFRATQCQAKSPIRTLDKLDVWREGNRVMMDVSARSFLHSQVRSFAGSLAKVGRGDWPEDEISRILDARDRKECGPVAGAAGLTLTHVDYADYTSKDVHKQSA